MIGSIAGGLIGKAGAEAGGQAAYSSAMGGATTAQNILNDQRKMNRVASSPYTGAGREALSQIGQLMGWGNLETNGGDDDWRFANWGGGGNQATATAQQNNARKALLEMAGVGANLPTSPTFTRLSVPTTFAADPGYAFRKAEGSKALERSALSRGKALSGEQGKALEDFNSGLASQEYGNWWNRYTGGTQFNNAASQQEFTNALGLDATTYGRTRNVMEDWMRLAGMGQGAQAQNAGTNSSLAGNIGNAFAQAGTQGGQALGAGYAKGAEQLASGIGQGINNVLAGAYLGFGGSSPIFGGGGKSGYSPAGSAVPRGGTWSFGG